MRIEARLREMGLVLPPPVVPPGGARLPFRPVRVVGDRALVSGHGPQNADGTVAAPFGKVGAEVSVDEAYRAARRYGSPGQHVIELGPSGTAGCRQTGPSGTLGLATTRPAGSSPPPASGCPSGTEPSDARQDERSVTLTR